MSGEDGDIPKLAYGSIEAAAEREKKNIHPKEPLENVPSQLFLTEPTVLFRHIKYSNFVGI